YPEPTHRTPKDDLALATQIGDAPTVANLDLLGRPCFIARARARGAVTLLIDRQRRDDFAELGIRAEHQPLLVRDALGQRLGVAPGPAGIGQLRLDLLHERALAQGARLAGIARRAGAALAAWQTRGQLAD